MLEDTRDKKFGSKRKHATGATNRKLGLCTLKMRKRPKNYTCPYYVPLGQGGGE